MKLFRRSRVQQEVVNENVQVSNCRVEQRTKPSSSFGRTVIAKKEQTVPRHPATVRTKSEEQEIKGLVEQYLTANLQLQMLEERKAQHEANKAQHEANKAQHEANKAQHEAELEKARRTRLQAHQEKLEI